MGGCQRGFIDQGAGYYRIGMNPIGPAVVRPYYAFKTMFHSRFIPVWFALSRSPVDRSPGTLFLEWVRNWDCEFIRKLTIQNEDIYFAYWQAGDRTLTELLRLLERWSGDMERIHELQENGLLEIYLFHREGIEGFSLYDAHFGYLHRLGFPLHFVEEGYFGIGEIIERKEEGDVNRKVLPSGPSVQTP